MIMSYPTPEEIQELIKLYTDTWKLSAIKIYQPADTVSRSITEARIRNGLKAMKLEMTREVSERDRQVDRAIAAVHRARNRHPNEMPRMPWID